MKFIALLIHRLILVWSFLLFILLATLSFLVRTNMPMDGSELANMHSNDFWFLGSLFVFILALSLFIKIINRVNQRTLFFVGAFVYVFLGLYLIYHQNDVIRDDAFAILASARSLNEGDFSSLTDIFAYLYRYPHQLGLVSFERIIITLFGQNNIKIFFLINLLMGIGDNFILWKLTSKLFKNDQISRIVIILSFLFLPHLYFILFVYGLTFGLFFGILGLYFLQMFFVKRRWLHLFLSVLFLVLADVIRNNYIILIMTVVIILVLDFLYNKNKKNLIFLLVLIISIFMANKSLVSYYEKVSNTALEGEPKITWVTMGLNDTPIYNRVAGWYDAYVENVYNEHNGNPEEIEEASYKQLRSRIHYMFLNPNYTWNFFTNKIISTWTDSLFGSIWSGPIVVLESLDSQVTGRLMSSIYEEKSAYKFSYYFSALLLVIIYVSILPSILIFFIKEKRKSLFVLFPLIYLSGGFLFHLIWETKSQYVYPYVYLLLPLSADGIVKFQNFFRNFRKYVKR